MCTITTNIDNHLMTGTYFARLSSLVQIGNLSLSWVLLGNEQKVYQHKEIHKNARVIIHAKAAIIYTKYTTIKFIFTKS